VPKSIQEKENSFTSKLGLNLRKKLVKCSIWNIALCNAEKWTLWKVEQKYLESSEIWCCLQRWSVGLDVWERKKYYIQSRREETSYIK
jgi:hypothetical protein